MRTLHLIGAMSLATCCLGFNDTAMAGADSRHRDKNDLTGDGTNVMTIDNSDTGGGAGGHLRQHGNDTWMGGGNDTPASLGGAHDDTALDVGA